MSWVIWFSNLYCRATHQRDRYKKSIGCKRNASNADAFKRIFKACVDRIAYCISCGMVGNEQMAAKFCIQDQYQLVGFWNCCAGHYFNCIAYGKLPGNKSSDSESGKEFEK